MAGPLATRDTPSSWWRGLRLLALDGTQFDLPDSTSNGDTFDGPSTTGGVPFGFPQVRAVVLAEIGTHEVLDARLGGYRDGERSLAYPLADSTGPGDLVIADCGLWSVEFAHIFTVAGADLLVRLQSNHLGTAQEELPDSSYLSTARPSKELRLRAAREGRMLPRQVIYRLITFAKGGKVAPLGTPLLDPEQYPAAELVALYRERWEIELAFDEIKNHLGPGGPIQSDRGVWGSCSASAALFLQRLGPGQCRPRPGAAFRWCIGLQQGTRPRPGECSTRSRNHPRRQQRAGRRARR
ncbi:Transposase DDE domain-containing protein [Streptomyces sp. ScaeMP-e83]|nr:Transposase DDE domain-containing protein [Streptomyces sp. ScaeMP-e83]